MKQDIDAAALNVLVVEDEHDLREALIGYLQLEGMNCQGVGTLAEAETHCRQTPVDVLLLDLGLPDGDGLTWLSQHAPWLAAETTVIIVSARNSPVNRVSGLRAGAYAYLTKPFLPEEVATLIINIMGRRETSESGPWVLETQASFLHSPSGRAVKLTHSEHRLMLHLSKTPNVVVSRQSLIESLDQEPGEGDYRRLEVMMRRLRNKVLELTGHPLPVETVHRQGYCFADLIVQKPKHAGSP